LWDLGNFARTQHNGGILVTHPMFVANWCKTVLPTIKAGIDGVVDSLVKEYLQAHIELVKQLDNYEDVIAPRLTH